jgi:hypothetical protein
LEKARPEVGKQDEFRVICQPPEVLIGMQPRSRIKKCILRPNSREIRDPASRIYTHISTGIKFRFGSSSLDTALLYVRIAQHFNVNR